MKVADVRMNSLVWSKKIGKFGQVIDRKDFMFLVLFASAPWHLWIHPVDLEFQSPNSLTEGKV